MRTTVPLAGLLLLAASACTRDGTTDDTEVPDTDTGSDTDTDTDTDTEPDCQAVQTFEADLQPTSELHVSLDGDDQADGSADRPLRTLSRAASLATPGTAIRIHPGTWTERAWLADVRGTAQAPIWVGGLPGQDPPVFTQASEGLHASNIAYVVLHDLVVRETSANGINIDDGGQYDDPLATHHVIVRDVLVEDIGGSGNQDCLKLSGLDDFWILDSTFRRCGGGISGSGVDMVGCHDGMIARNELSETSGSGVQAKGGTMDVTIAWNTFTNAGERGVNMGGSTGYEYFRPPLDMVSEQAEARRVWVHANLFRGGVAAFAFVGCDACQATHNTILDPERWVVRILQETRTNQRYTFAPSRDGRMVNNLVVLDRSQIHRWINIGDGTEPDSFTFTDELWWGGPDADTPPLPGTVTGLISDQDPQVDADGVPASGSPAQGGSDLADGLRDRLGSCYQAPYTRGSVHVP